MESLHNLKSSIHLFFAYSKVLVKAQFQYRLDALLRSFAVFAREMTNVIIVYLTFQKFGTIKGWNMDEMLFLFSMLFLSYSLLILIFTGFRDFDQMVRMGELDRFLVRPLSITFQVIVSRADYLACIGHGAVGILLFFKAASNVGIVWTFENIVYFLLSLVGAILIQAFIFLLSATISFWTQQSGGLINFLFFNARKFAGYPLSFFPAFIQKMLIFVIPFAFVNYFPTQFFLRKDEMHAYWEGMIYLGPLVGLILFTGILMFWRYSIRYYSSAGN